MNQIIQKVRTILVSFSLVLFFVPNMAQVPQSQYFKNGQTSLLIKRQISQQQKNTATDTVEIKRAHRKTMQKKKAKQTRINNQFNSYSAPVKSGNNSLNVPTLLTGEFQCKGVSYFGGIIKGTTTITADKIDKNKIWIDNLIPGNSNQSVYAIVESDEKTLTIPQGQIIYKDEYDEAQLKIHNSTSPISGTFNITTGTLEINSNLWGSHNGTSWFEVFSGAVTYTRFDMLPPEASYKQPQGGLFLGLIPNTWDSYLLSCIIASPYVTWNWGNNYVSDNTTYTWSYTDMLSEKNYSQKADSLLMIVEESFYTTPLLKATDKNNRSSTFKLGSNFENTEYESYTVAGGNATWLGLDENCDYSVANLDNGFDYLVAGTDAYYFGTGASSFAENDYKSLLVYYEQPQTKLYFTGVNVYLYVFEAPENTVFTMNIFKPEKDEEGFTIRGESIAKATITAKDVTTIKYNNEVLGYTMQFSDFQYEDIDGFIVSLDHIETDNDFYLELSGFDADGVKMAVASEIFGPADGQSRSFFSIDGDESIYFWEDHNQTMYFNLQNATYSYISFSETMIYDNRSGGTYTFNAYPYFDNIELAQQDIPDWLSVEIIDEEYSDNNWKAQIEVTIDPLSENEEPRYYDLFFNTTAATNSILINQGGEVSNPEQKIKDKIYAYKNNDGHIVFYPENFTSMKIYNLSGKIIGKYSLSNNGNIFLSNTSIPKGIHIISLFGSGISESIKIKND